MLSNKFKHRAIVLAIFITFLVSPTLLKISMLPALGIIASSLVN